MTAPEAEATAAPKRRGRKPRASREEIVDAAIELLERDPYEPLTIARVADAVGLAPMTLYRYFDDRAELLGAIVRAVRAGRPALFVDADLPWQGQVADWMAGIATRSSATAAAAVHRRGRAPGLAGRRRGAGRHARAPRRLGRRRPRPGPLLGGGHHPRPRHHRGQPAGRGRSPARCTGSSATFPEDAAARMARVIPGLARLHDVAFDLVVERTVASLDLMLPPPAD